MPITLSLIREDLKNMNKLIEMLDDNDDTQAVYHDAEIPEEEEEE